jgi:hypothetical protein
MCVNNTCCQEGWFEGPKIRHAPTISNLTVLSKTSRHVVACQLLNYRLTTTFSAVWLPSIVADRTRTVRGQPPDRFISDGPCAGEPFPVSIIL